MVVTTTREEYDKDIAALAARRLAMPRAAANAAGVVYDGKRRNLGRY